MNSELKISSPTLMHTAPHSFLSQVEIESLKEDYNSDKIKEINQLIVMKMEGKLINHIKTDLSITNIICDDIYYLLNKDNHIYEEKDKTSLANQILDLLEHYRSQYLYYQTCENKDIKDKINVSMAFLKSQNIPNSMMKTILKCISTDGDKDWQKYTDTSKCMTLSKLVSQKLIDDNFHKILNAQKYQLPIKNKKIIDLEYDEPLIRTRGCPYEIPLAINKNPKQKGDYFSYILPYEYIPRNDKNKEDFEFLDKYILDLSTGDEDKAKFLKTVLGSILIKGNPSQKFFLFTGAGSNGKSMLLNIINELFEELKVDIDASLIIDQKKPRSGADPFLIEMNNPKKRLMILSETKEGINFDDTLVKRLTGDDNIKARALYSNKTQQFKVDSKLIVVSNHRPKFNVYDYGMKRRPIAIDFNSTFVKNPKAPGEYKKDPSVYSRIISNKNILFSWFVEGAYLFKKNHMFDIPNIIKEETENYFYELDSISQYLEESSERVIITKDKTDNIQRSEIFNDYVSFCKQNNITFTKKTDLFKKLDKLLDKKKINGNICFVGIKWADDTDQSDIDKML